MARRGPARHAARHPQRLRGQARHLPQRAAHRRGPVPRVSRRRPPVAGNDEGPAHRHVLHRRHPLREGRAFHGTRGLPERLPARRRHPEVFRGMRLGPLRRRMLRLRPARGRGPEPARNGQRPVFRLSRAAYGRGAAGPAICGGCYMSALLPHAGAAHGRDHRQTPRRDPARRHSAAGQRSL